MRLLPTGRVEVIVGTSPHGQGHVTTFSQITADTVGVPFDDVDVMHGDTDVAPWGLDTYGSRSIVVGGAAVLRAARQVVDKARVVAAHMLEVSPDDLEFGDGRFSVRGDPDASRTIQDVAFAAFAAHDLPPGADPVLLAEATVDPEAFSYPHGTHLCAVEVDTATGRVKVRSYVAVDDVGTVINPMIVDGQVHGGVTQGLAQALYEEAVYDGGGNLVTGSLVDYLVPSAADVPPYVTDRTETPATTNPLGVKGAGEAGTIGATPAVVNAVVDALRPYGVTDVRMPCTPERVWRATHGARVMIPPQFDCVRPRTVDEAVAVLGEHDNAKLLAGGQSLLPILRLRLAYPDVVVDLNRTAGLRGVRDEGDHLVIGAMTTHYEVIELRTGPAALRAARRGHRHGRRPPGPSPRHLRRALSHADPAGDLPAVALAFGTTMVVAGAERAAYRAGVRVLRGLPADRAGTRRGAGRGPGTQARRRQRVGIPVREVPACRAGLGHRRRGRAGAPFRGSDRTGARRPHQHGFHAATGDGDRGGPERRPGHGRCRRRSGRAGRRRDEPGERPQRAGRLPAAPGPGPDPERSPGRSRNVGERPALASPDACARCLAGLRGELLQLENEFSVPAPVSEVWKTLLDVERIAPCMPGATVDRVDGDEVAGRVRVKVGPITASYAGTARFVTKDEAAHRFVLEGSGRETRGSGTASATVEVTHERTGRRHPGEGGHLARGHRQAGAVRPGRHGRHRGQAHRSVRRVPRRTSARSRRTPRPTGSEPTAGAGRGPASAQERTVAPSAAARPSRWTWSAPSPCRC